MMRHLIAGGIAALLLGVSAAAAANPDVLSTGAVGAAAASGADDGYRKECGSCHMAYPPQFLPARSWRKIVGSLSDHFGENAELAPEDVREIEKFLSSNAADQTRSRLRTIARWVKDDQVPLRISELPYFVSKHNQVPDRMVKGNPAVKSFSRCAACHRNAESQGSFDDHDIDIPGFGHWEEDDEE
jgi:hypothetical protein